MGQQQFGAGRQHLGKGRVACVTRRLLDTRALPHLHTHDRQRHAARIAGTLAMRRPGVSLGMQSVVNMNGVKRRDT